MQYLFKTRYNDDIRFLAKTGEKVRVAIVVILLLCAPLLLQDYYLAELGLMLVYAIAGIGLMVLTGAYRAGEFRPCSIPRDRGLYTIQF